jgi:hypothetical protein
MPLEKVMCFCWLSKLILMVSVSDSPEHTVLLLFSGDTPDHAHVVEKFANFIKLHCACDVKLMNTLKTDSGFLLKNCRSIKTVVAVHSKRCLNSCSVNCGSTSTSGRRDVFRDVLDRLQREEQRGKIKLHHVAFHYTEPDYITGIKFGKRAFRLVAEMPDFVAQLNGKDTVHCNGCQEGQELLEAFNAAGGLEAFRFEIGIIPPNLDACSVDTDQLDEMCKEDFSDDGCRSITEDLQSNTPNCLFMSPA